MTLLPSFPAAQAAVNSAAPAFTPIHAELVGPMEARLLKPGSPLLWKGAADGKLYVKGNIVSVDAPHHLAYTVIDPNSTIADIPENYLTMTYSLKQRDGNASVLEIAQGDFTTVANGEQRYNDTVGGDDFILMAIKKIAESQVS